MTLYLRTFSVQSLLSRYIAETRNKKGDLYTTSTLHQLLCGPYRHIKTITTDCPNFVDKNSTHFKQLHGTLDSLFRKLHENGIGRKIEIISRDEEEKLWSSGQLGSQTPRALQNATCIFFLNGKNSCIREHRSIKTSLFQRLHDPECYIYHEFVWKNRPATFRKHVDAKVVPIYCHTSRCHLHLLDLHISKLPPDAIEKDLFYTRPLERLPANDTQPWYTAVPVGRTTLGKRVKDTVGLKKKVPYSYSAVTQ